VQYFAWEQRFFQSVDERREVEVKALRNRFFVLTMATGLWLAVPLIITAISFFFYTVVEKKPLLPSTAFTALTLIGLLRIPLDRIAVAMAQIQQGKASVDRIQALFDEREIEDSFEPLDDYNGPYIGFQKASISWEDRIPVYRDWSLDTGSGFRLVDIDIAFHKGGLNIVTGPIGSGKSTLLTGLLGELSLLGGSIHLPRYDGIAYCAQEAWLLNKTVRENIIFSSPWDEDRYQAVIEACALIHDLETLPQGDQTPVADRGLALSGGQKQRISLARAAYSTAKNLLLDDCLSAVDSKTAQHIFTKLLLGPLMVNRTIILVTHAVALCAPQSQHIVALDNGRIAAQGSYEHLVANGDLDGETQTKSDSSSNTPLISSTATTVIDDSALTGLPCLETSGKSKTNPTQREATEQGITNADDQSGALPNQALSWNTLKMYLDHMGPWYHWVGILVAFTIESVAIVATNNWIRKWSGAYHEAEKAKHPAIAPDFLQSHSLTAGLYRNRMAFESWHSMFSSYTTFMPQVSNSYYLEIYGLLASAYIVAYIWRCSLVFKGSLNASRTIHSKLLASVLGAKFSFFDTTPVGQIVNRWAN
jgi:ABC-type multidrug transport system fused ATPase/permease subunit